MEDRKCRAPLKNAKEARGSQPYQSRGIYRKQTRLFGARTLKDKGNAGRSTGSNGTRHRVTKKKEVKGISELEKKGQKRKDRRTVCMTRETTFSTNFGKGGKWEKQFQKTGGGKKLCGGRD